MIHLKITEKNGTTHHHNFEDHDELITTLIDDLQDTDMGGLERHSYDLAVAHFTEGREKGETIDALVGRERHHVRSLLDLWCTHVHHYRPRYELGRHEYELHDWGPEVSDMGDGIYRVDGFGIVEWSGWGWVPKPDHRWFHDVGGQQGMRLDAALRLALAEARR